MNDNPTVSLSVELKFESHTTSIIVDGTFLPTKLLIYFVTYLPGSCCTPCIIHGLCIISNKILPLHEHTIRTQRSWNEFIYEK